MREDDTTDWGPARGVRVGESWGVLQAGDLIAGRFEVRRLLGRGGMGVVYEAEDRDLGILVALKTLLPDMVQDEEGLRLLKREVLMARRVSHPNVCRLHDLGHDADRGLLFCTMEILEGETLSDRLSRLGPLSPVEALPLVRQMALGLDAAHAAGVVHRDFKSANVMLVPSNGEERAAVTDFGIASRSVEDSREGSTDGRISGTPAYMAPEQMRGERAGPAADIYALGVVLHEMATGRLPFEGEGAWGGALRKLEEDPPSPRRFRPELPSPWEETILRCLSQGPAERFGSARAVVAALAGETDPGVQTVRVRGNLPAEVDAFVGREEELGELDRRLASGSTLVTLVGPAGSGKTRLALRHAQQNRENWPGGVWFCNLTEARTLEGIASAVATALDVPLSRSDPIEQLGHAIAGRGRCLMLLDNFEQVVDQAAATVGRWRERAGEAVFLVTSRERLHLAGEEVQPLGPLSEEEAEELFLLRAEGHRPGFAPEAGEREEIARMVRRLEGLPLAIELAAARVRVMGPRKIAERLSDRFQLLSGGKGDPRHAALRVAIDGSWELLEPWERAAFAQASVFEGGFTLEAAEEVLDLSAWEEAPWIVDVVQALLDKSLLRMEGVEGGEPRFGMYVSLQEYGRQKMEEEGPEAVRRAEESHGEFFARLGSEEAIEALRGHGGVERRRALGRELENLVAVLRRAVPRGQEEKAVAAYLAAWAVLEFRGPLGTGEELGRAVVEMPGLTRHSRARALRAAGSAHLLAGRMQEAREHFERALVIHRALGDRRGEGIILGDLGIVHRVQGRMEEAREHFERALEIHRALGNRSSEGIVLQGLGNVHIDQGRSEEARGHFEHALEIYREVGDRLGQGLASGSLGIVDANQGRMEEARERFESALEIYREVGNRRYEGIALGSLASVYSDQGRLEEAREHNERALEIHREVGDRPAEGVHLGNLGNLHQNQGRMEEAREHYERALKIHREGGDTRFEAIVLTNLGGLHEKQGRMEEAREHFERALELHREVGDRRFEGILLGRLGECHAREERIEQARSALDAGEDLLREVDDKLALGKLLCARGRAEAGAGEADAARAALEEAISLTEDIGVGPDSDLGKAIAELRAILDGS